MRPAGRYQIRPRFWSSSRTITSANSGTISQTIFSMISLDSFAMDLVLGTSRGDRGHLLIDLRQHGRGKRIHGTRRRVPRARASRARGPVTGG